MSQESQILQALQQGDTLTALQALERFGVYALSQRCTRLRAQGHPIVSKLIRTPSGKHVAEYHYQQEGA